MTWLDTGCLVKLYYPEPDSPKVIALVQGQPLLGKFGFSRLAPQRPAG